MSDEVTEPKVEEPKVETNELQAMMTKLDELGITNVEQLQNQATASSEAGRLGNIVGDLRSEIEALKVTPPPAAPAASEYDDGGLDIEAAIGNALDKKLDEREAKANKIRVARTKEAQAIRSSRDYQMIGKDFEQYMVSAQANARLSSGDTPTIIFNDMVKSKYRSLLQEVSTAATAAQGDPSAVAVPYVETGGVPPPRIEPADEKKTKLNKLRENWSGNDEDLEKTLNALLPSGTLPMPSR
jgi:hypothetical protein